MKIEIDSRDFEERCYCHLCGNLFVPRDAIARAYNDRGDWVSDVCPTCLATGVEGISERMQQRANYLRLAAAELERLAHSDINAPSLEELTVMNQVIQALH
ncbi:hypothetical protein PN462_22020 [Spirulina sp. CS-785/01]|uniref:hypothetical protein n=1 Tax=Spirulina sp. CS-785/01 TaxID=3021716 RepID=UPI00232D752D|nr:hypothetical protein [Spirulina sp. CS-785/01]MDB9315806.1 hypothetical protein [Spirulina sp. CS-785/01]